ncbi:MAG: NUDIX hydrolase [Clostridia bacterium]|nr:NUDIX hydrolase [Clostridia bacterium]
MDMTEKTIDSEELFDGRVIRVRRDTVELPNGSTSTREVVEHPGGVAIVPVDADGNVYMVRQYRYPLKRLCLELPAGKLEYGEDHRECGIRELSEETGMEAGNFEYLGVFCPSPGFCQELIHLYLATDLREGERHPDEDEFLEVERYPLSELVQMIQEGKLQDGKTVIGLLLAKEVLQK